MRLEETLNLLNQKYYFLYILETMKEIHEPLAHIVSLNCRTLEPFNFIDCIFYSSSTTLISLFSMLLEGSDRRLSPSSVDAFT